MGFSHRRKNHHWPEVARGGGKAGELRYRRKSYTTLVTYLLVILGVWWCLRFTFVFNVSHGEGEVVSLTATASEKMDVVGIAVKPTCVTEFSIEKLNEFLKPRLIHVFTPSETKCELFRAMADNVRCYTDGEVVPGVSKKSVEDFLEATFENIYTDYIKKTGKKLAGWYLQQVGRHNT